MEVELKLLVSPQAAQALRCHPLLLQHATSEPREVTMTDIYYDTPDLDLRQGAAGLRVRHAGNAWIQTLKAGGSVDGGLHKRHEWESQVAGPMPDLAVLRDLVDHKPTRKLLLNAPALEARLVPVFSVQVTRMTLELLLPQGDQVELALDQGTLGCGGTIESISEIELELKAGNPVHLFDFALALQQDIPLQIGHLSKAERGFELFAPQAGAAVRANPFKLRKQMTVEQAFQAITLNCMAQVQANGAALAKAYDVDCLHQMRVGLRRLRSALGGFKDLLQAPGELRQELEWLVSQLGAARDWDVLVGSTLPALGAGLPADIQAAAVERAALARSNENHAAVSAAVNSQRYSRLVLRFSRWVLGCEWREEMAPAERNRLEEPAAKFGRRLLAKSQRRLLKRGGRLHHASPEARHLLRIAAKKMRYATEFFQSLYPSKQVQPAMAALSLLQDDLGRLMDAAVAGHLLQHLQNEQPHLAASASFIRGCLASTLKGGDSKIRKALKKFAALKLVD